MRGGLNMEGSEGEVEWANWSWCKSLCHAVSSRKYSYRILDRYNLCRISVRHMLLHTFSLGIEKLRKMEDEIKKTKLRSTCRSYQLHCNRHKSVNYQPLNIGLPRGARCSRAPTHTYMWLASIIIENGQLMITDRNILSSRLNLTPHHLHPRFESGPN